MNFVRTTILGGILFLLPLVVVVVVVGKALTTIHALAGPLLGVASVETFAGAALVHLVSLALLVAACFIAGVIAQRPGAGGMVQALERDVLMKFPPYALFKVKTGSALNPEEQDKLTPVLVRFDDSWQLAYQIEQTADGREVVFLPSAPDPWSGTVCSVEAERVAPLDETVKSVGYAMKRLGKGTADLLGKPA